MLLSHAQVLNKHSYHPKTVTLDPSPVCVGTGSIWIFIGISTSFFSLGCFLTTRICCSFHAAMNVALPGWCLGNGGYVCALQGAGGTASRGYHSSGVQSTVKKESLLLSLFIYFGILHRLAGFLLLDILKS